MENHNQMLENEASGNGEGIQYVVLKGKVEKTTCLWEQCQLSWEGAGWFKYRIIWQYTITASRF